MIKQFTYIVSSKNRIQLSQPVSLNSSQKIKHPWLPILWNRDGRFGIIPVSRIENIIQNNKDMGIKWEHLFFIWNDTLPIPQTAAKLLISEDVKSECTYSTKSDTPSS